MKVLDIKNPRAKHGAGRCHALLTSGKQCEVTWQYAYKSKKHCTQCKARLAKQRYREKRLREERRLGGAAAGLSSPAIRTD